MMPRRRRKMMKKIRIDIYELSSSIFVKKYVITV